MNKTRVRIAASALKQDRGERGMTLVETLVALAIFGLVAGVFLAGLYVSSKSVMVSQERVAAESLAKSQMESIKALDYDTSYSPTVPPDLPQGYAIGIAVEPVDGIPTEQLQKITVTVTRNGDGVFTLVDYKVNR